MIAWQKMEQEFGRGAWRRHEARGDRADLVEAVRGVLAAVLVGEKMKSRTWFRTLILHWCREAIMKRVALRADFRGKAWGDGLGEALRREAGKKNSQLRAVLDGAAAAVAEAVLDDLLGVK